MAQTDLNMANRHILRERLRIARDRFKGQPLGFLADILSHQMAEWSDDKVAEALEAFSNEDFPEPPR